MKYDMNQCGSRIRQLRIEHGYTQEKVAELLNVDRSFYSRIETGKKSCSINLLIRLSTLYNVSLDYLILGKHFRESIDCNDVVKLKEETGKMISHLEQFKKSL